jgi:ubiquinone/menaquinone biosynthesis C-methylase UbiE
MNDKITETKRYDTRAADLIYDDSYVFSNMSPLYSRVGEKHYRKMLSEIPLGSKVLEIGAGMGENTECLLECGFTVCATDISSNSVRLMEKRFVLYEEFSARVADMEALPFPDGSFDVICSAGALSYGDNSIVRNEIYRVLKSGGQFIALDSLNHNPIYKLNRYIHFLRGHRSKSTLQRMPTQHLIDSYTSQFGSSEVNYFGSLIWVSALLKWILSGETISILLNHVDNLINVKKSAFKFTIKVVKS